MSDSPQSLLEIRDQVCRALDADAESQKAVRHAELRSLFGVDVCVRREARLRDEGVHAAKAGCMADQLELSQKSFCGARATGQLEGHHTTEPIKKRASNLVVRMRRKTRVMDAFDLLTLRAPLGDSHCVLVLSSNANVERLDSTLEEPAGERIGRLPPEHHLLP